MGRSQHQPQAAESDAAPAARQVLFLLCESPAGAPPYGELVCRVHAAIAAAFACPEIVKRGRN